MVYAGKVGKQKVSLGVSGRLKDANMIMWDEETNSLWSQIKGEALYGKSKGKQLDLVPAIFVGLGTWKKMHPKTLVLNMSTVRARSWYYTTEDMARGSVEDRRRGKLKIGLGLRHAGDVLAVDLQKIQKDGVVQTKVGEVPIAIVWVAAHSVPLVYDRRLGGDTLDLKLKDGQLQAGNRTWDPLTGKAKGKRLRRFPYIPTYMNAWKTYYPNGKTL